MAAEPRPTEEIYDEIAARVAVDSDLNDLVPAVDDSQTFLADINSPSQVAEHRIWMWVFSYMTWLMELKFWNHQLDIEDIIDAPWGHLRWWKTKALAFQDGYALTFVNDRPDYSDTTTAPAVAAKVVKYASATQTLNGEVVLKVAKDLAGDPVPLTAGQVTSFEEYAGQIKPGGVFVIVRSEIADWLKLTAEVFYDPLVIDAAGELIASPGTKPVEDAIEAYIDGLPFDGVFSQTALKDAVQAVDGVNDFTINSSEYQLGITGWNAMARLYETHAGFIRVSVIAGETLSDTLTYTAGT